MNCRTARLLLDFGRPLAMELEEDDAEALQEHLVECPECGTAAQIERSADHAIGQAMRAVAVPAGLQNRLRASVDVRLRSQYRRRWRRIGFAAAAAACLAFVIGFILWWPARPIQIQLDDVAQQMPLPGIRAFTPSQAQETLHSYGFDVPVPMEFNYQTLQCCDRRPLKGRDVPVLIFTKNGHQACVYILKASEWDLGQVQAGSGIASGVKVVVHPQPGDSEFVYLISYNSESLQLFLSHPGDG
jgi:hypothetical protein